MGKESVISKKRFAVLGLLVAFILTVLPEYGVGATVSTRSLTSGKSKSAKVSEGPRARKRLSKLSRSRGRTVRTARARRRRRRRHYERFTASSFANDSHRGRRHRRRRSDRSPGRHRRPGQHERHRARHRADQRPGAGHGEPEAGAFERRATLLHHQAFRGPGGIERRPDHERHPDRPGPPQPHESHHRPGPLQQRLL